MLYAKLKLVGGTYSRDMPAKAAVYKKKAFAGRNIQEKPSKQAKFDQTLYLDLVGHLWPADSVFETPVLRCAPLNSA